MGKRFINSNPGRTSRSALLTLAFAVRTAGLP